MTSSHLPSFAALSPPEPQWHPSQQLFIANASTNLASASFSPSISQPLSQPYPTPQTVEASPRELDSRSSESLNPSLSRGDITFSPETSQSTHDSFLMRYSRDYENILAGPGTSNSRTHSQQGTHVPLSAAQSRGYQQNVPSSYSQYQSPSMSRTWSSGNHSAGLSASEMHGGAPSYHDDLAQIEMRHHQSSEHINHKQVAHHVPAASAHLQARSSLGYQNRRTDSPPITSRSATSDPQFVSGPWASTPPASGVPQPPHYN